MTNLEKALEESRRELLELYGNDLISLLVFGSAAVGEFVPGSSDINLVAVLRRMDLNALDKARMFRKRMAKYHLAAPLLMTEEYLNSSTDVFPIEFIEIKEKHRQLHGPDLFADLEISPRNLRHECEHEVKGRLLRLRDSYIEVGNSDRALKALLATAHNANLAAFRASLRLKNVQPPVKKDEIAEVLAEHFGLDAPVFHRVRQMRQGELDLRKEGLRRLFEDYCHEVEKLARALDQL